MTHVAVDLVGDGNGSFKYLIIRQRTDPQRHLVDNRCTQASKYMCIVHRKSLIRSRTSFISRTPTFQIIQSEQFLRNFWLTKKLFYKTQSDLLTIALILFSFKYVITVYYSVKHKLLNTVVYRRLFKSLV